MGRTERVYFPGTVRTGLEYNTVLRHIGAYAGVYGRRILRNLRPVADPALLERRRAEVAAVLELYEAMGQPSLRGLPDIRPFVRRARMQDAWLAPAELLQVAAFFDAVADVRRRVLAHRGTNDSVLGWVRGIPPLRGFRHNIRRFLTPDGDIVEAASPRLRRLTREWRSLRHQIEQTLKQIVSDPARAMAVQDQIFTRRDRRWVILVRADQQQVIPGLVLGASGSGASVYLEPYEVVELNNRYVLLEDQRKREIVRILRRLTRPLARVPAWTRVFRRLARLDVLLAIAAYARDMEAHLPRLVDEEHLALFAARHPILEHQLRAQGRTAVPLELEMGPRHRVLILTGPNAGGKTVVLKTVGLLTAMAHAGLPVPAASHSQIPYFSHIFADIGDQQDLYQSLSTFASHMKRIRPMFRAGIRRGLFLLDELGTGTDPVEGAALGRAILETLKKQPGKVLAVTHLPELKLMALDDPEMLTASMEFVAESLSPTFRLVAHSLGASHALDIAKWMGIPEAVLERARSLVRPEQIEFIRALQRVEASGHQLEQEIARYRKYQEELEKTYRGKLEELAQQQRELREAWAQWQQKIQSWWEQRRREWERMVMELQDPQLQQAMRSRFKAWFRNVERERWRSAGGLRSAAREAAAREFRVGQTVRIRGTGAVGKVVEARPEEQRLAVVVAGKRMEIPAGWAEPVESTPAAAVAERPHILMPVDPRDRVVNLLGYRVEDARERLEQALDRALRAGFEWIRVIHGYRPGRLKKGVLEFLREHPLVARVEEAPPNEGGPGASRVFLRGPDSGERDDAEAAPMD